VLATSVSRLPRHGASCTLSGVDDPSERSRNTGLPGPRDVGGDPRSAVRPRNPTPADEAAADEAAADEARLRLREQGIVPIEPDDRIGAMLAPEELVLAIRRSVSLERRKGWREPGGGLRGDLYVTTRRLVHLGRVRVEYALGDIQEAVVADSALRLVIGESGVEIKVPDPRLLRVQVSAVREGARAAAARIRPIPAHDGVGVPDGDAATMASNDDQGSSR